MQSLFRSALIIRTIERLVVDNSILVAAGIASLASFTEASMGASPSWPVFSALFVASAFIYALYHALDARVQPKSDDGA